MALQACGNTVPVTTTCVADDEQLLFFNVAGQPSGMALRRWVDVKCCLIRQMFGTGILTVLGSELIDGIYYNQQLPQDFLLYGWGIPNLLIRGDQWDYITNSDGRVEGFEVFIGYDDGDRFTVIPNPTCAGSSLPEGETINESIEVTGENIYTLEWTSARRSKYGNIGSFLVFQSDGTQYNPTAIQPVFSGATPIEFIFDLGGIDSIIVIS